MKYELRLKTDDEVVDTIDFSEGPTPTANTRGAKAYFMARKMLEEKEFDKIYKVTPNQPVGRYKWWEEERTNLDDF